MKRAKKIGVIVSSVVVFLFVVGLITVNLLIRKGLTDYTGTIKLKGLTGKVQVYRDGYAIPHIYAENEDDLYRVTGYLMAQDRLWQMDLLRRFAMGRLSELVGKRGLQSDYLTRVLDMTKSAKTVYKNMDKRVLRILDAFTDGVNQFIAKGKLPMEFSLLGYTPEKWQSLHSVYFISIMAWKLSIAWHVDVMMNKVKRKVGEALYKQIVPKTLTTTPVYTGYSAARKNFQHVKQLFAQTSKFLHKMGLNVFEASNNWAVSGKKTKSGKPLFANDMHLSYSIPGTWYQMHQVCKKTGLNVTGVSLPGQPFVTVGHNARIAWGMTTGYMDDADYYIEKTRNNGTEYLFKGKWLPVKVRAVKIKVKGEGVVVKKIRSTIHGPIISDLKGVTEFPIAMRWGGQRPSYEIEGAYLVNRAANWKQFRAAMKKFTAVCQNVNYADVDGNIGIQYSGSIPMRGKGAWSELLPGWDGKYEWKGFIPFEKNPFSYNPKSGFVASANNQPAGKKYPYYINGWCRPPYRIDRIREVLSKKKKFSLADNMALQLDLKSKMISQLLPDILAELKGIKAKFNKNEAMAYTLLTRWDGVMRAENSEAAVFEQFYICFLERVFKTHMGNKVYMEFAKIPHPADHALLRIWKKESVWYDDPKTAKKENFSDVVRFAFRDAIKRLKKKLSSSIISWEWAQLHTLKLRHPLSNSKLLALIFPLNRGPYRVGGSSHTVMPYSYSYADPYGVVHGASQRHLFDLDDWDKSLSVIPTGNSGIVGSPHYCDQTKLFVRGEYHPDLFSKKMVLKHTKYKQQFIAK